MSSRRVVNADALALTETRLQRNCVFISAANPRANTPLHDYGSACLGS